MHSYNVRDVTILGLNMKSKLPVFIRVNVHFVVKHFVTLTSWTQSTSSHLIYSENRWFCENTIQFNLHASNSRVFHHEHWDNYKLYWRVYIIDHSLPAVSVKSNLNCFDYMLRQVLDGLILQVPRASSETVSMRTSKLCIGFLKYSIEYRSIESIFR